MTLKQRIYPWLIVAGCCCMQVGGIGIFLDCAGVFYVPASRALGVTVGEYSSFLSFSFLSTILSAIIASALVEKVDIRVLISINVIICGLDLALMGYYPTMLTRNIAGLIFGFCGGFFFMIMTPVLINNWFAKRKGLAMGIAMSSTGFGAAVLSPLITLWIEQIGWQLAYVCTGMLVLVLILPWVFFVFRAKPSDIGLKPFGWEKDELKQGTNVVSQARQGVPYPHAWRTLSFFCICLFVGCIAMFSGYNSHLNAFGQSLGYSAMVSSTLLIAVSIGSIIEKVLMGFLYDYIGVYCVIYINCVLLSLGLLILGTQTELVFLYIGAALFGVQTSLVAVQLPLLIRELFGDLSFKRLVPLTCVGIGALGALGPVTIAAILGATGSYHYVWLTSLAIVVVALCFLTVARLNKKRYIRHWRCPDALDDDSDEGLALTGNSA